MAMYPKMADIIKEREGERFKVDTFEITYDNVWIMLSQGISPGKYARLIDKAEHACVMSDTQKEINAVLDDIRAEIMDLDYDDYDGYEGAHISPMVCRNSVMEIINKHKTER